MLFNIPVVVLSGIFTIIRVSVTAVLVVLLIRALLKYLRQSDQREKTKDVRVTLGETLKNARMEKQMTQEFVAESIGVSRQAVSKWENGTSDPSTSNLIALSRLYDIPAGQLPEGVTKK
ncbi:MAG: helix-turn-helix domain-containing protein [Bulleidia sp.]